jgi:hypothetical protein
LALGLAHCCAIFAVAAALLLLLLISRHQGLSDQSKDNGGNELTSFAITIIALVLPMTSAPGLCDWGFLWTVRMRPVARKHRGAVFVLF